MVGARDRGFEGCWSLGREELRVGTCQGVGAGRKGKGKGRGGGQGLGARV